MDLLKLEESLNFCDQKEKEKDSESFEILHPKSNLQFSIEPSAVLVDGCLTVGRKTERDIDFYKSISFKLTSAMDCLLIVSNDTISLKHGTETIWEETFEKGQKIVSITTDYDDLKSLKSLSILHANGVLICIDLMSLWMRLKMCNSLFNQALTSDFVIEADIQVLYRLHLHITGTPTALISIPKTKYQNIKFSSLTHELVDNEEIECEYIIVGSTPFLQHFQITSSQTKSTKNSFVQVLGWTRTKIDPTTVIRDDPRAAKSCFLSTTMRYVEYFNPRYLVITDTIGRFLIYDTTRHIIIRIYKGMRNCQCAWVNCGRDILIVYLDRGVMEVHSMELLETRVLSVETIRDGILSTNPESGLVGGLERREVKIEKGVLKTGIYLAHKSDSGSIFEIGLREETLMLSNPSLFDNLKEVLRKDGELDFKMVLEVLLSFQYPSIQIRALEYIKPEQISPTQYSTILKSLMDATEVDKDNFEMQMNLILEYERIKISKVEQVDQSPEWLEDVVLIKSIFKSKSTGDFQPMGSKVKQQMDFLGFIRCFMIKPGFSEYGIKELDERVKIELCSYLFDGIVINSHSFETLNNLNLDVESFIHLFIYYLSKMLQSTPKPQFWKRAAMFLYITIHSSLNINDGIYLHTAKSEIFVFTLSKFYMETDQPLLAQLVCVILIQIYTLTKSESEISNLHAFITTVDKAIPLCLLITSIKIIATKFNIVESYSLPLLLSQSCPNNYQVATISSKLGVTVDPKAVDAYKIFSAFTDWTTNQDSLDALIQFIENFFVQSRSEVELIISLVLKGFLDSRVEDVVKMVEERGEVSSSDVIFKYTRLDHSSLERMLYLTRLLAMYISTRSGDSFNVLEVVKKTLGDLESFDDLFGQFITILPEVVVIDRDSCNQYQVVTAILYFTTKFNLKGVIPSCLFPKSALERYNLKRKIIALVDQDRFVFTSQLIKFDQAAAQEMDGLFKNV